MRGVKRRLMFGPLLAIMSLGLTVAGCANYVKSESLALKTNAASDLQCSRDRVVVKQVDGYTAVVKGCGQLARYEWDLEHSQWYSDGTKPDEVNVADEN